MRWSKRQSIISMRGTSFRWCCRIRCGQRRRAACLTLTAHYVRRTRLRICFIFPVTTSSWQEPPRKHWQSSTEVSSVHFRWPGQDHVARPGRRMRIWSEGCWLMRRRGRNTICSSIWAETISEKSAKSGPCRWKNIWRSSAFPTLCTSVQRLPA